MNVVPSRVIGLHIATVAAMVADDPPLRIEHGPDGLVLSGEIDAHSAALLREVLFPAPPVGDLRIDMSQVTFIDSSGLRVVLEAHQAFERDSRRLVLVAPSRQVARVITVAGLVAHLHVDPRLDTSD